MQATAGQAATTSRHGVPCSELRPRHTHTQNRMNTQRTERSLRASRDELESQALICHPERCGVHVATLRRPEAKKGERGVGPRLS